MRFINSPAGRRRAHAPAAALCLYLSLASCGGGGGGGGGGDPGSGGTQPPPVTPRWTSARLIGVNVGGLTTPRPEVSVGADGSAYLFYFEPSGDPDRPYSIRHGEFAADANPAVGLAPVSTIEVVRVDNCAGLAVVGDDAPAVLYQGGEEKSCGTPVQADAMVSSLAGSAWNEATAAIGVNPRNPYFVDGFAGVDVDAVVDAQGRIHTVYQFTLEGCDAMNFRYQDLRYVRLDPDGAGGFVAGAEETVEGNDYIDDNNQNSVGQGASLVLRTDGTPVVFYGAVLADGHQGLRVARRGAGGWVAEWVDLDLEPGSVSAAVSPADGSLAVAYQVVRVAGESEVEHALRVAHEEGGAWQVETVDDATRCGEHCALAIAADGTPHVAYRELETHAGRARNALKHAVRGASGWQTETVQSSGDMGHFNSAWVGSDDHLRILTYAARDHELHLFRAP